MTKYREIIRLIGHALALGIDMKEWMEKNKTVIIPIQEHMENLLWVWGKLVHDGWEIKVNTEILVGEIMERAKKIYGEINGLSVHMLYDAYIERPDYMTVPAIMVS